MVSMGNILTISRGTREEIKGTKKIMKFTIISKIENAIRHIWEKQITGFETSWMSEITSYFARAFPRSVLEEFLELVKSKLWISSSPP